MILHCIGCGKASQDKDWAARVDPLCTECASKPEWRDYGSSEKICNTTAEEQPS